MVVIIIGILATMAAVYGFKQVERSKSTEALQTLGTIRNSEQRYKSEHGIFTTSLNDLDYAVPASTQYWNYSVTGTEPNSQAQAVRKTNNKIIRVNLDSGASCTDDPSVYGIPAC